MATLCICIVFVPVVFITGAAKYLFTPLAMAVVFAMLTSYLLSRTLVPTLVHYLLASEVEMYGGVVDEDDPHAVHARHAEEAHAAGRPVAAEDETIGDRLGHALSGWAVRLTLVGLAAALGAAYFLLGTAAAARRLPAAHGVVDAVNEWVKNDKATAGLIVLGIVIVFPAAWLIVHLTKPIHDTFNRGFERFQRGYGGLLAWALSHRAEVVGAFTVLVAVSCSLLFVIGKDFFPTVDAGQMRLHVRCPPGTRIEQTEQYYAAVENDIRKVIDPADIKVILDNMGIPNSSINTALSDGSQMSAADGEVLISLNDGHRPTAQYMAAIRRRLPGDFPDLQFFFAPADIVTQVLNFGLQAPIDVQIATPKEVDVPKIEEIAENIKRDVTATPGIVDVRMEQVPKTPDIRVNVDRTLASEANVTQQGVAQDLLISLSSSNQTAPNYWLGSNGVNYQIYVQTPQYQVDSVNELDNTPITPTNVPATPENVQLLGNLATTTREVSPTNVTHYDIKTTRDVLMDVSGTDLGTAGSAIDAIVARYEKGKPPGSSDHRPRAGAVDARLVQRPGGGAGLRHHAGLPADGHQLPELGRPADHPHGPARRAQRHPVDALGHADAHQRPRPDGVDHEHRRGHVELDPDDHLRQRPAAGRAGRPRRGVVGRHHAATAGDHDGAGHDHRHAADEPGAGRGRRAERPAGPGRHRRADHGHLCHAVLRAGHVQPAPAEATRDAHGTGAATVSRTPHDPMPALPAPDQATANPHPPQQQGGGGGGGGHGPEGGVPHDLPRPGGGTILLYVGIFVLLLAALLVVGIVPDEREKHATRAEAARRNEAKPVVQWLRPVVSNGEKDVTLPCDVSAYQSTAIYPRTSGYLKSWTYDIGRHVRKPAT